MSRIGKQLIQIPQGVTATLEGDVFCVSGPRGSLKRTFPGDIVITCTDREVTLTPARKDDVSLYALWGTYASHILNMIRGVKEGFAKKLVIEGVGYRAGVEGQTLVLSVGFSHPVRLQIPPGIDVTVEKNVVTVSGNDIEAVGVFASDIRRVKKPEPYKGKGIRYENEVVRRKQGKRAVT